MIDPRDTVDIPDDRESDDHIPDAVCDAQTVLGDTLTQRISQWATERIRMNMLEDAGDAPADGWHDSDDDAADIVQSLVAMFEIPVALPEPRPEDALDGTLRTIGDHE